MLKLCDEVLLTHFLLLEKFSHIIAVSHKDRFVPTFVGFLKVVDYPGNNDSVFGAHFDVCFWPHLSDSGRNLNLFLLVFEVALVLVIIVIHLN